MPCLLQVSLCVCLGFTQLIQCREYRFAVKVSTCNNLPSKIIILLITQNLIMSRICTNFKGWMGDSTLNVCAASAPHSEMEL